MIEKASDDAEVGNAAKKTKRVISEAINQDLFMPEGDIKIKRADEKPAAQIQHFNTVITLADDLEKEQFPALYEAISYINFRLVCGAYALDEESGSLVFKLSVPMPIDLQGEDLIREINICSGNAVAVLDQHIDLVLGIADGEATMDDVKATWI